MLSIDWQDASLPTQDRAGYGVTTLPVSSLAERTNGKPVLVYFYSESMDSEKLEKMEGKMFGCDILAIASKFFDCMKIDIDEIESQETRDHYAKKVPSFYVLDGRGQTVKKRSGKTSPSKLTGDLKKAYKAMFGTNLAKRIAKYNKTLDRMGQLEELQAQATAKIKILTDRLARREAKRTRKQLEEMEAKLAKTQKGLSDLAQERASLLTPEKKVKTVARSK